MPDQTDRTEPRWNLIRRIREQIARGTYITDRKLEVAAERLLAELHRHGDGTVSWEGSDGRKPS